MPLGYYSGGVQSEAEWVLVDTACRMCGQNLRGLHVSQACPGCGTPAGFSAAEPLLRFAHPGWLARVRSGLLITLWATLATAVVIGLVIATAAVLTFQAEAAAGTSPGGEPPKTLLDSEGFDVAGSLFSLAAGIVLAVGTFRITAAEPVPGVPESRTTVIGRFARVAVVVGLAYTAVQVVLDRLGLTAETSKPVAFADAVFSLVQIAALLAVIHIMAGLAARVPDAGLRFRARLSLWGVGIGAALVVLLGLIINLVVPDPGNADLSNQTFAANVMAAGCAMALAGLAGLGFFVLYVVTLWQLAGRIGEARAHAEQVWAAAVGTTS